MRALQAAGIATIAGLIAIHGLIPDEFVVDSTTVALLVLLVVLIGLPFLPVIRRYISELSVMGTSIKFREYADRADELATDIATEAAEREAPSEHIRKEGRKPATRWPRFVEIPDHLYHLVGEDPKLAVAGLGIEIERVVREAVGRLGLGGNRPMPLARAISSLRNAAAIDERQAMLLRDLVGLRNLAVHGHDIDVEDARRFFEIVEKVNDSVSLGYSPNFSPNEDWEAQGLVCKYEHCIEHMPLKEGHWDGSCPVFGHDCPGGVPQVQTCKAEGRSFENLWGRSGSPTSEPTP
jgi:hypothetical protein